VSFNVLFRGLVCHLTNEKVAVFVRSEGHELRLLVRPADIVAINNAEIDKVHAHNDIGDDDGRLAVKVEGSLTIEGIPPTHLDAGQTDFKTFVPSLPERTKCRQRRAVIDERRVDDKILGYLDLPGGTLVVRDFFRTQGQFPGDARPQCFARRVQLELTPNGGNVTIRNGTYSVELKPDAEVEFVNVLPRADDHGGPNHHFGAYFGAIYEGCETSLAPDSRADECNLSTQRSFADPGTDCSNSHDP
jgi:hypothetical protein